jgi:hypothetical protein
MTVQRGQRILPRKSRRIVITAQSIVMPAVVAGALGLVLVDMG